MDLLVPCIVEGRSELRNIGRVNCKTHWPFFGLRNTSLTERISHFAVCLLRYALQCAWLSVRCCFNKQSIYNIYIFIIHIFILLYL